jgi:cell division protease FtsH
MDKSITIETLAQLSPEFSGAKLAHWVKEATHLMRGRGSKTLDITDFDIARDVVQSGARGRIEENLETRRRAAYHEAGHALVGGLLQQNIHKVSVLRINDKGGITEFLSKEGVLHTKKDMLIEICIILAGRAAEELFCSEATLGDMGDIKLAKKMATDLIERGHGSTLSGMSGLSEVLEIENILQNELARAKSILEKNKEIYQQLVSALMERHVLYQNELQLILSGKPLLAAESSFFGFFSSGSSKFSVAEFKLPAKKEYVYKPPLKLPDNNPKEKGFSSMLFGLEDLVNGMEKN